MKNPKEGVGKIMIELPFKWVYDGKYFTAMLNYFGEHGIATQADNMKELLNNVKEVIELFVEEFMEVKAK